METIIGKLDKLNNMNDPQIRKCKAVRIQAWKDAGEDQILGALIERILYLLM